MTEISSITPNALHVLDLWRGDMVKRRSKTHMTSESGMFTPFSELRSTGTLPPETSMSLHTERRYIIAGLARLTVIGLVWPERAWLLPCQRN